MGGVDSSGSGAYEGRGYDVAGITLKLAMILSNQEEDNVAQAKIF